MIWRGSPNLNDLDTWRAAWSTQEHQDGNQMTWIHLWSKPERDLASKNQYVVGACWILKLHFTCLMLTVLLSHWNDGNFQDELRKRKSTSITIAYTKSYKIVKKTCNIIINFNSPRVIIVSLRGGVRLWRKPALSEALHHRRSGFIWYERFLCLKFEYQSYHKDRLVASNMLEDSVIKYVDTSKYSN